MIMAAAMATQNANGNGNGNGDSLAAIAEFLRGNGKELPDATKRAIARSAMQSQTRVFVIDGVDDSCPANNRGSRYRTGPDGVTRNYSASRMVAVAFGKGTDESGKTIMGRPNKMRAVAALAAEIVAACDDAEARDNADDNGR